MSRTIVQCNNPSTAIESHANNNFRYHHSSIYPCILVGLALTLWNKKFNIIAMQDSLLHKESQFSMHDIVHWCERHSQEKGHVQHSLLLSPLLQLKLVWKWWLWSTVIIYMICHHPLSGITISSLGHEARWYLEWMHTCTLYMVCPHTHSICMHRLDLCTQNI